MISSIDAIFHTLLSGNTEIHSTLLTCHELLTICKLNCESQVLYIKEYSSLFAATFSLQAEKVNQYMASL